MDLRRKVPAQRNRAGRETIKEKSKMLTDWCTCWFLRMEFWDVIIASIRI